MVLFLISSALLSIVIINLIKASESAKNPVTRVTTETLTTITVPGIVLCSPMNPFYDLRLCEIQRNGYTSLQTTRCHPNRAAGSQFDFPVPAQFLAYGATMDSCAVISPSLITFEKVSQFVLLQFDLRIDSDGSAETLFFGMFDAYTKLGTIPEIKTLSVITARGVNSVRVVVSQYDALHTDPVLHYSASIVPLYGMQSIKPGPTNATMISTSTIVLSVQSFEIQKTTEYVLFGFVDFLGAIGGAFSLGGIAASIFIGNGTYRETGMCQWCVHRSRSKREKSSLLMRFDDANALQIGTHTQTTTV